MKTLVKLVLFLGIALPAFAQETTSLPPRLARFDRDGDGRLSREEAGNLRFFRQADANGDGFVTGVEIAALIKARRNDKPQEASPAENGSETSGKTPAERAADYSAQHGGRAVIVMVAGKITFERYDNGFGPDTATHLHSATKGFWGPVIAAMTEDGLIESFDELACDTLPEWRDRPRKSRITLRHLLSLSAGLVQDVKNLQGHKRPTLAPDLYKHAIGVLALRDPGSVFQYGPSCYYVLGEIMKRKLAARKQTPLDYLKQRILDPIGCETGTWVHDASGNPHIPNGAHLTARQWVKYGQWLLQGGAWEGKQIVRKDLLAELVEPCQTNAGHGLALWLNRPGGKGGHVTHIAPKGARAGFIYHDGCPDLFAALGAGKCRLYVIPSLNMVALRQADSSKDRFSDHTFLDLLLDREEKTPWVPAGDTRRLSPPGRPYIDPEILQEFNLVTFLDRRDASSPRCVWVGKLDPMTGLFKSGHGRDILIDTGHADLSFTHNGPEWALDRNGWSVIYTKPVDGVLQMWRGFLKEDQVVTHPLTSGPVPAFGGVGCINRKAASTRIIAISGSWDAGEKVWVDMEDGSRRHAFGSTIDHTDARWVAGTNLVVSLIEKKEHAGQLGLVDTDTGSFKRITQDKGRKDRFFGWLAPEAGGKVRVLAIRGGRELVVYEERGQPFWEAVQTHPIPAGSKGVGMSSPEPFVAAGRSYATVSVGRAVQGDRKRRETQVWIMDLSGEGRAPVRIGGDGVEGARQTDAEAFVGTEQVFVIYSYQEPGRQREMRRTATGIRSR